MPQIPRDEKSWWALKIVALLHDVPWKPWLIAGSYRARRPARDILIHEAESVSVLKDIITNVEKSTGRLEANDEEAIASILFILNGVRRDVKNVIYGGITEYWSIIHEADIRASSTDRLLSPRTRPLPPTKFVNVFRPELVISTKKPPEDRILEYLKKVREIVEKASEAGESVEDTLKKIYFALYALIETTWYKVVGSDAIPPADTRIPHHTVFHHLYASSAMLNTIGCWALVEVDVPGIQNFVKQGRKTRDFWAGSWLVSFLTWRGIEEFVKVFGPDIVLSPAVFLNPFYLDTVIGLNAVKEEDLPHIAWRSKWPEQPVVPGTVTLLIPIPCREGERGYVHEAWSKLMNNLEINKTICSIEKIEHDDSADLERCVKAIVEHSVKIVWGKIVDKILKDEKSAIHSSIDKLMNYVCKDLSNDKHKEECKNLLVSYLENAKENPPIKHRVIAVKIRDEEAENSIMKNIRRLLSDKDDGENLEKIIDILKEFLEKDVGLEKERWINVLVNTFRITYAMKKLRERLNQLPAISIDPGCMITEAVHEFTARAYKDGILPRYRVCSLCGKIPAVVYLPRGKNPEEVGYLLDEGEALCPYCLVRRVLAKYTHSVLENIIHTEPSERALLSTLDIANIWRLDLIKELEEMVKDIKLIRDENVWRVKVYQSLAEEIKDEDTVKALKFMDRLVSQKGFHLITETSTVLSQKLSNYVAYVVGDGDNLGKGCWKGILPKPSGYNMYKDYIRQRMKGSVMVDSNDIWSDVELNVIYLYSVLKCSEVYSGMEEETSLRWLRAYGAIAYIGKKLGLIDPNASVIVTPSYVYTLSHSLLISSLVDSLIVEALGGVLIYSGGDDIAAIVPINGCITKVSDKPLILPIYALSVELSKILPASKTKDVYNIVKSKLFEDFVEIVERGDVGNVPILLLLVIMTRLNYWGMISTFMKSGIKGFHIYEEMFAPAIAAYGKSYGVLIAHQKDPMWIAYDVARELEELKDAIKIINVDRVAVEKDLLVSTYGRVRGHIEVEDLVSESLYRGSSIKGGVSAIPLSLRRFDDVATLAKSVLKLYTCIMTKNLCRKGLIYSMLDYSTVKLLVNLGTENVDLVKTFLEYLIRRHVSEFIADKACNTLLDTDIRAYELSVEIGEEGKNVLIPVPIAMVMLLRFLSSAG